MEELTNFEELEDDDIDDALLYYQKESLRIQEYSEHIYSRKKWSTWLLYILVFLVITNVSIVFFVGLGFFKLDLDFLKVVYVSMVFEILGLVSLVVHFLFKKPPELL